jgi:hypothetical protein
MTAARRAGARRDAPSSCSAAGRAANSKEPPEGKAAGKARLVQSYVLGRQISELGERL